MGENPPCLPQGEKVLEMERPGGSQGHTHSTPARVQSGEEIAAHTLNIWRVIVALPPLFQLTGLCTFCALVWIKDPYIK